MKEKRRSASLIIGPCLFAVLSWLLQPAFSAGGAEAIGMLAWMICWWSFCPVNMTVTALLPIVINALLGIVPMNDVISQYASPSVILIFGTGLLSAAWARSGLDRRMALRALAVIGPSLQSQISAWFLASAVLSIFMPNVAVCALYCPIAAAMLKEAGYDRISDCPQAAMILLAIGWGAGIGGAGSPLGGAMNLTAISCLEQYTGKEFMYIDWVVRMAPYVVLAAAAIRAMLLKDSRGYAPIQGSREFFRKRLAELPPISEEEIADITVFAAAIATAFLRPLYAKALPMAEPAYIFLTAGMLMFLIRGRDHEPLLAWHEAQEHTLWGMMILFGGGIALGTVLTESGAVAEAVGMIHAVPGGELTMIVIFSVCSAALSETTNSTVSAAVIIPAVISTASSLGQNPVSYWLIASMALNAEFLLPISIRAIPVSYGLPAGLMLKKGIPVMLVRLAIAVAYGYLCMKLVPGFSMLSSWN